MRLLPPACCQLDMALCSLRTVPCAGPDGPQGILPVDHAGIFHGGTAGRAKQPHGGRLLTRCTYLPAELSPRCPPPTAPFPHNPIMTQTGIQGPSPASGTTI